MTAFDNIAFDDDIKIRQRQGSTQADSPALNEDSNQDSDDLRMKRRVGLWSAVALIVGTMIGSGIFVSSGNLLSGAKSPGLCLVLWTVCGFYSLLGAISYSEIGTLIPKSGGEYTYFLEAFGPLHKFFGPILSFLFAWVTVLLLKPTSLAINSLSFSKYLLEPILTASGICLDDYLYYVATRITATAFIFLLSFINSFSVTLATRVQVIFTVAKLAAISIIIGGGIYYICIGYTENLDIGFAGSETSFGAIAQAFYGGLWAFDGWNQLNYITEELENPYRNLPLAILIGIPLTTACYVLVNVAYLTVLTVPVIENSSTVAVDWANIVLGPAAFLVPLGVVISIFGTANGSVFTAGRISHVAAKEGHMLDILSYIHVEKLTPVGPIMLNAILGIIFIIPGEIGPLVDCFGFTTCIFYCMTMVALILMRFTRKDAKRPITVPIVIPIFVMLASAYLVIAPIIYDPKIQYVYALLFILAGLIFYVPFVYFQKVVPGLDTFRSFLQKLLLVAPTSTH